MPTLLPEFSGSFANPQFPVACTKIIKASHMQNDSSLKKYQLPLTCAVNFAYIIWLGSGVEEVLSNVSLKYHVPTAESP